jgi:glycosyltransferase 2 family protein
VIAKLSRSLWVRAVVTAVILALLFRKIPLSDVFSALSRLRLGPALTVLVLVAMDRCVMIWRWIILLRAAGQKVSTRSAIDIYLVSSFVGGVVPAAADVARAYSLRERTAQGSAAAASVAVDRVLGLLALVLMAIVGLIVTRQSQPQHTSLGIAIALLAFVLGAAALLWTDRWVRALVPTASHSSRAGSQLLRLADAVAYYRDRPLALSWVAVLSGAVQVLRVLQAYVLGIGIGIDVPFTYYLLFMPIGLIALMLPISISGFGAPQGLIVWMLKPLGVPEADAFALSTLIVLSGIIANLPGALLYLRRPRTSDSALLTSRDSSL